MAKKSSGLSKVVTFIAWLTGVIVSLSVGFALINATLDLPTWLGGTIGIPVTAGYIVVFTTLLGVILALINKVK